MKSSWGVIPMEDRLETELGHRTYVALREENAPYGFVAGSPAMTEMYYWRRFDHVVGLALSADLDVASLGLADYLERVILMGD